MSGGFLKRSLRLDSLDASLSKRRRYDLSDFSDSDAVQDQSSKSNIFSKHKQHKQDTPSPSELENSIELEIKGLIKRKQLGMKSSALPQSTNLDSLKSNIGSEKPIFTFDEVLLICQNKLQEREKEIRENYDAHLQLKLAEQYDDFIKFTHDQMQRNCKTLPSYYLS